MLCFDFLEGANVTILSDEEIVTKKRSLRRYRKNVECIHRLEEKLEALEVRLSSGKTSNYSGMPRGGVPIGADELISDKIELEKRIENLKKKAGDLKAEILSEIDSLEDSRYCEVLEGYFIDCLSLDEVADNLGYTERWVFRLYNDAIKALVLQVR